MTRIGVLSVEDARQGYLFAAWFAAAFGRTRECVGLHIDAASLDYDLAVAWAIPCHGWALTYRQEMIWQDRQTSNGLSARASTTP